MGTVKAWLRDDWEGPEWADRPTQHDPVQVTVPEDLPPTVETEVNPRLTVRLRSRTGYDDETGAPEFDWTTLIEDAPTILWTEREEFDADAGLTRERARATLRYEGSTAVTETASISADDGRRWRVVAVRQVPGRLELEMERLT